MKTYEIAVNNLRVVAAEMITTANSGHPGIALGSAPILYSLYSNVMKYDPKNPNYFNRDRFVMSAGHGSSILYATLHLFGFDVSKNDLSRFRQLNSITPGHPEKSRTPGVDCSTGPLGQGIANAVGMAIAEKHLADTYNKQNMEIFNNHVYALCGEGCLMEGISYEALCLAGTLNLNNFTVIYDRNNISIEGDTKTSFNIDIEKYFESLGFKVYVVKDGNNDVKTISSYLNKCKKEDVPTAVICNTSIGFGSVVEGSEKSHGSPLKPEQLAQLKENLKITEEKSFEFNPDVRIEANKSIEENIKIINKEIALLEKYKNEYPEEYAELVATGILGDDNKGASEGTSAKICEEFIEEFKKAKLDGNGKGGRDMSHECLQLLGQNIPNLFGGCADLAGSTKAFIKDSTYITSDDFTGKNIHFGIREHAMGAICNGMALCNVLPFASTFMSFSNYMFPAMRMACLDKLPVLYIFSHDSFRVGEDGPTHQSIEQIVSMRSMPGLNVFRPFNMDEMKASFVFYMQNKLPTVISTGKDKITDYPSKVESALRGGYVISKEQKVCQAVIVATGYEVQTALEVQKLLLEENKIDVRVVSMPNMNEFEKQNRQYIASVIPADTKKIVIEPASKNGWSKIVGKDALFITKDDFGASAKASDLLIEFGFENSQIATAIKEFIKRK